MQDTDVFAKTEAGRDEIKSRSRGLSMAVRAILLMVDGQRNVAAIQAVIDGSKAPAGTLVELVAQGLIEARFTDAAAAPVSIATPRSATLARSPAPPPAVTAAAPVAPAAVVAPVAPVAREIPLDLTLPTIFGTDASAAALPATSPSHPAPSGDRSAKDRYEHLYTMINDVVRDFLPAHRRYMIQLKIERAGTPEELLEMLDYVQAALVKAKGEEFAAGVVARLRAAAG